MANDHLQKELSITCSQFLIMHGADGKDSVSQRDIVDFFDITPSAVSRQTNNLREIRNLDQKTKSKKQKRRHVAFNTKRGKGFVRRTQTLG